MRTTVAALVREIRAALAQTGGNRTLHTVFVGGGTPTVLGQELLRDLFGAVAPWTSTEDTREITVEVNPEDVTAELLDVLASLGVNRVSVGMQSMSPTGQATLGRCTPETNRRALSSVADRFENFSVDVLLGVPGESTGEVTDTLTVALEFRPPHVSAYCLERGGDVDAATGQFFESVDPEALAPAYLEACRLLAARGYTHYEVSNFAQPGRESLHNCAYWTGSDYVGVGPGAHSFVDGRRFSNPPSLQQYLGRPRHNPLDGRVFDARDDEAVRLERLMLGLRTRTGLPRAACRCDDTEIRTLHDEGLLECFDGNRVRLSDSGYLILDEILFRIDARAAGNHRT